MRWLLALGMCAALLGLGGCGGGNDTASTTTSSTTRDTADVPRPEQQNTPAPQQGPSKQTAGLTAKGAGTSSKAERSTAKAGDPAKQSSGSRKIAFKLVKVPPISSAATAGSKAPAPGVKTVRGGDNTVQEYGVEADESARTEAAVALQSYLNERLRGEWAAACSALAQKPTEQLERLATSASRQGTDLNGCPATMAFLQEGEAQLRQQATITEVLSFRGEGEVPGNPSFLIYTGPPADALYGMPMYLEGGGWRVGLARADELPVR